MEEKLNIENTAESVSEKKPFKDFLHQSANLFAVLGVCGAFFVVSPAFKSRVALFVIPQCFFLLFLLTGYEILVSSSKSNNGSFQYQMFFTTILLLGVSGIFEFITSYSYLSSIFVGQLYGLGMYYLNSYIQKRFVAPKISRIKSSNAQKIVGNSIQVFMIASLVLILMFTVEPLLKRVRALSDRVGDKEVLLQNSGKPSGQSK